MRISELEVVEMQGKIIAMQEEAIDGLFAQISQMATVEEIDGMKELKAIEEATRIKKELERRRE